MSWPILSIVSMLAYFLPICIQTSRNLASLSRLRSFVVEYSCLSVVWKCCDSPVGTWNVIRSWGQFTHWSTSGARLLLCNESDIK